MDANGRKFENRVAAWRESVEVVAGLHLIEHAMRTMNKSSEFVTFPGTDLTGLLLA